MLEKNLIGTLLNNFFAKIRKITSFKKPAFIAKS